MAFYTNLLILTIILPASRTALRITSVSGPSWVRNGSSSTVVLDCEFSLENEADKDGLVVKWYFNQRPFPVYQWIPGNKPQALGLLRGRVDLPHVASTRPLAAHRALALRSPTLELTGEFACGVSSFGGEDRKAKTLVVYVPASDATLTYRKTRSGLVRITCLATGLFPEPEIEVYRTRPDSGSGPERRDVLPDVSKHVVPRRDATTFDVTGDVTVRDDELLSGSQDEREGGTVFACTVRIPGTDYELTRTVMYTTGQPKHQRSVYSGGAPRLLHSNLGLLSLAVGALLLLRL